jgi:hypothetical protein
MKMLSSQVKIEALNALVYVILVMKEQKYRHEFHELQKLIPAMLEVLLLTITKLHLWSLFYSISIWLMRHCFVFVVL